MYRVLIVDDFIADRENIREVLEGYTDVDIEIVGECENGIEALEAIDTCKPDIIICDIEMPLSDGFELAKHVRTDYPNIRIIFCSLYDEFEYAKKAIYFDGCGYILKPVDAEELKQYILKISGQITDAITREKTLHEYESLKAMLDGYRPMLADNLLKNLIYGLNSGTNEDLWDKINYLGIPIKKGIYVLAYLEIDDFKKITEGLSIEQKQIVPLKVFKIIEDLDYKSEEILISRLDDSHFVAICNHEKNLPYDQILHRVSSFFEKLLKELQKYNLSVTISISDVFSDMTEIKNLYEQCVYLMKYKFSFGKGKIISNRDVPSNRLRPDIEYSAIQKQIRFLLNSGSQYEIDTYIEDLFPETLKDTDEQCMKNLCFYIVFCIQVILNENNENFERIFSSETIVWEKLLRFETIMDVKIWIKNILLSINQYFAAKMTHKNKNIVAEVKKYIQNHFTGNISLEAISADLYYSPNYLNYIFKKETGETVFDWASRYKIEKAKELIMDPKYKLFEISDLLGYSNPAYFSSVFKKHTGITPKEYRERYVKC